MSEVIHRLNQSIQELEQAVKSAKETLSAKYGADHPVVARLESYSGPMASQKENILKLQDAVNNQNLDEVFRLTQIINALSGMIKEDARSIVDSMYEGENTCEVDKDVLN